VEYKRELEPLDASHGVKELILAQSQAWKKVFIGFLMLTLPVLGWITERVVTLPETYIVKGELREMVSKDTYKDFQSHIVKRLDRIDNTLVFIIQEIGKR